VENLNYLFGAYLVFWFLTTGYLVTIDRRQKELRKTIEKLDRQKT
jgi:CcmD family protein